MVRKTEQHRPLAYLQNNMIPLHVSSDEVDEYICKKLAMFYFFTDETKKEKPTEIIPLSKSASFNF